MATNPRKSVKQVNNNSAKITPMIPLQIFLFVSPFFAGIFHEPAACVASMFLLAYLLLLAGQRNGLRCRLNLSFVAVAALAAAYLLSAVWAVDKGMALLGAVKFLPVLLLLLVLMQLNRAEREQLLPLIPLCGVLMTILSFGLKWLPPLQDFFTVNQRLAGFFQYPNTFALFLLLGVIILAFSQKIDYLQLISIAVLLFGILQTGSRTVFILLLLVTAVICFIHPNKKVKKYLLLAVAGVVAVGVAVVWFTASYKTMGRFLTISLSNSELLGRLLYYKDAVPVILHNPLGLGYMGYYFAQQSFQTGVYSVAYIHNELLQLLLDVGWLPALLLTAAIIKSFFTRYTPAGDAADNKAGYYRDRLLLAAIAVHCLFDFDLQFLTMFFILLLVLDLESGRELVLFKTCGLRYLTAGFLFALSAFFAVVGLAYYAGNCQLAVKLYPLYTNAQLVLLQEAADTAELDNLADNILNHNRKLSLAWSAKAAAAYSRGDFKQVVEYKSQAIALAPYTLAEYLDYIAMLKVGLELYAGSGDAASAAYCRQQLLAIPDMLAEVKAKTDDLAWQTYEKPELDLPAEYQQYLTAVQLQGQ